ncbi:hypothetical protein D9M70_306650 [compost metagenome]
MTLTLKRTSGRMSAARPPSVAATRMCSQPPAMLTVTCLMRGSSARVAVSTRLSSSTFSLRLSTSSGLSAMYSGAAEARAKVCTRPCWPARAIERAACAAVVSASRLIALLYAKPVFSPDCARTPTPWSRWKLPSLTMPSSSTQVSETWRWKYRSAASMPGPASSPSNAGKASMDRSPGASNCSLTDNNRSLITTPHLAAVVRLRRKIVGGWPPACADGSPPARRHRVRPAARPRHGRAR